MPSLTKVNQEFEFVRELSLLVRTSQEISVMQIQKIRSGALATRTYMDGLLDIFFDVRASESQQVEKILNKKVETDVKTPKRKESVIVLLSTNQRFSGSITREVFTLFAAEVRKRTADVIVIGKIGKELYQESLKEFPYTYLDLNLANPSKEELSNLISRLLVYEKIDVYKGRYESLGSQKPVSLDITGKTSLRNVGRAPDTAIPRRFLFEPSLTEIIAFFETQVTTALFRGTLHESRLATLGSRISALESSLIAVEKQGRTLERKKLALLRARNNRKQLQRLAGAALWK